MIAKTQAPRIDNMHANAHQSRKCVVCRAVRARAGLIRIATDASSIPVLDWKRSKQSRGCYICYEVACLGKLTKTPRIVERHLKRTLKPWATERLKEQLQNVMDGKY